MPKQPKPTDKGKPPARKQRPRATTPPPLGKPEVMEAEAFDEAKATLKAIGKDFDDVLKRAITNLARKHGVTESLVYTAISHRLMDQAVEIALSAILLESDRRGTDD